MTEADVSKRGGTPVSAGEWLEATKEAERRGELLLAVDLAERGLAEHPDDLWLRHRAVLCLARSGSTREASERYRRYGLESHTDEEDIAALRARLAKDRALGLSGDARRDAASEAAGLYLAAFQLSGGHYSAVNAATLSLLAGDRDQALQLAGSALAALKREDGDSYYAAASEAEARLLLGERDAAAAALAEAASRARGDEAAKATTRKQLRLVCKLTGTPAELLGPLRGPAVAHYCGHRLAAPAAEGRLPAAAEPALAAAIAAEVGGRGIGYAYGSLAAGADILWAEALLDAGCELHVVLPFDRDEFIRSSVAPSGAQWIPRFERCLAAAEHVRYATDGAYLADDVLYRYAAELAMGLALLRARYLDAEAVQLAVWDGGPARGEAGTAIDVARWRRAGRETVVVPAPDRGGPVPSGNAPQSRERRRGRVVRALLFADVRGFSTLTDEQLPRFTEHVLGGLASVLDLYGGRIEHRNTWGDAVYLVLDDPEVAAACALDLQTAMEGLDRVAAGLPDHLALRASGHVGPVFPTTDPILGRAGFMGSHVSRTARIEPVTPAGAVYVTGPFAAALALRGDREYACDYVGHMPAAKDYGKLRMYRLRRRAGAPATDANPALTAAR